MALFVLSPRPPLEYKQELFLRANDGPYWPHVLFFLGTSGPPHRLVSVCRRKRRRRRRREQPREIIVFMLNWCPLTESAEQMRRKRGEKSPESRRRRRRRQVIGCVSPSGRQAACRAGLDRCMLGNRRSPKRGADSHCSPLEPPRPTPAPPIRVSGQK